MLNRRAVVLAGASAPPLRNASDLHQKDLDTPV